MSVSVASVSRPIGPIGDTAGVKSYVEFLRRDKYAGPTEAPYIATWSNMVIHNSACTPLTHTTPQAMAVYIRDPMSGNLNLVDWSHPLYTSAQCNGEADVQVLGQQADCRRHLTQTLQVHVCRLLQTNGPEHYSPVFVNHDVIVIPKMEVRNALDKAGLLDVSAFEDMEEASRILLVRQTAFC